MNVRWFENTASKMQKRSWVTLEELWLSHLPPRKGRSIPEFGLNENPILKQLLLDTTTDYSALDNVVSMRSSILVECIFDFVKGANILTSSQLQVTKGHCNGAVTSAYQSSIFFAKSILALSGIYFVECGRVFVLDIWKYSFLSPKELKSERVQNDSVFVAAVKASNVDHKAIWYYLTRLFRICKFPTEHVHLIEKFQNDAPEDFAYHRNKILYHTPGWPFKEEDMRPFVQENFPSPEMASLLKNDESHAMYRAFWLGRLAFEMLSGISKKGGRFVEVETFEVEILATNNSHWYQVFS